MTSLSTDHELLDRWRGGDAQAGNDLFRRHFQSIYRFFRDKAHGEADELIQATFYACIRGRDQFRKDCSFRAYLFTLARHELYAYFRRRARQGNLDFSVTSLADLGPSPSHQVDVDERRVRLARALRGLPLQQQLVLELHYWEGMRPAQLARIFEIGEPTARVWLFRARKALRERIEQDGEPTPLPGSGEDELGAWAQALREYRGSSDDGHHD